MERINLTARLQSLKESPKSKAAQYEWQDYVLGVIKDFAIHAPQDKVIWKWAKKNIQFLKGRVENVREQAAYQRQEPKEYAGLLIWLLNKK